MLEAWLFSSNVRLLKRFQSSPRMSQGRFWGCKSSLRANQRLLKWKVEPKNESETPGRKMSFFESGSTCDVRSS